MDLVDAEILASLLLVLLCIELVVGLECELTQA